ncbi:MAG: alpha/beta hydrolase [Nitrospinota bacterium]|nr:MAG: alpha/beta hydrolase [Nitrospinota bacterium]
MGGKMVTAQPMPQGLPLFDAARSMGVVFARETLPQDRFVTANGLRFHYLEWGEPHNPPILMLHGFAQTCHSWDFVALSLCDRFRVLALDQRGHGDSEWAPDGDYSPAAFQRDLHAVVQALNLHDFVLIGLSMGGRNAFSYAANHPERVKALVIVDAAPETRRAGVEHIRRFVQSTDELDSFEDFVERVRQYNPRRPVEQLRGSLQHNLKQLPNGKWTWKYDRVLRAPGRPMGSDPAYTQRLWGYLEALQCPTLVVRGAESDVVALETAERMHQRIPNSTLVTVERAGHLVPGDNPAGFVQAVTAFLATLEK